jgi:hypothetical protein
MKKILNHRQRHRLSLSIKVGGCWMQKIEITNECENEKLAIIKNLFLQHRKKTFSTLNKVVFVVVFFKSR